MNTTADRYARLCHAYIQLSDRFQRLDVEYMSLKNRLIPVLKAVQTCKQTIDTLKQEKAELKDQLQAYEALKQEKAELKDQLQALTEKYEAVKPFEVLLDPDLLAILDDAEEQLFLVEQTIQEQDTDAAPDLDDSEKQLLLDYQNDPDKFLPSVETNGSHPPISSPSMAAF